MSSGKPVAPRKRRTSKPPSAQELRLRLAHNVQRLRCARKLTIEQAADVAQIHSRHWYKIEDGEANATLRTLTRIAAALEVSVAELFRLPMRKGKR
jgi:transcriptional regulator with XRE-family HTH domain